MTIREFIRQGLHYARTCKSLWLFGFFVGASGGSGGGGGGGQGSTGSPGFSLPEISPRLVIGLVLAIVLVAVVGFVMRFISEGALIEGVARVRQGGTMTTREGFRAGWAHWGVLLRIGLLYLAAMFGSLALLAIPCVIALRALGPLGGIAFAIPAAFVAVPWLVTLFLVQAFASRIAVFENRHAIDAIQKARLFLHGRLMLGLKLIVATIGGMLLIFFLGLVALAPVLLLLRVDPRAAALGALVLVPVLVVLIAMIGTLKSSIWTIGYLTQVES